MDNVVRFPGKQNLFSNELKTRLEEGLKSLTEKPAETVTATEQVICTYLVSAVCTFARQLGARTGEFIARRLAS